MFRMPKPFQLEMSMKEAVEIMINHGRGDLIEGMDALDRAWDEHVASWDNADPLSISDGDFYVNYAKECNAYNVIKHHICNR